MDAAWPAYAKALKSYGAHVVSTFRRNALDVLVCEVRDCLHREGGALGRVVDSNCSITRRDLPRMAQPSVHLEPSRVAAAVRKRIYRGAGACVRSSWADALRFATDDLLGFSRRDGSADEVRARLNASGRAWAALLTRLGAAGAAASAVSEELARSTRHATRRSPLPHAANIANAEAVRTALHTAGLARVWRD